MKPLLHPNCRCTVEDVSEDTIHEDDIVYEDSVMISFGKFVKTLRAVTVYVEEYADTICHTTRFCDEIDGEVKRYAKRERMEDCPSCSDWPSV